MNRLTHLSWLAACYLSTPTLAEVSSNEDYTQTLETQTVFGNKEPMGHLSQEPVRVELITRAELEATHAIDLKDALKYSAGIQMRKLRGKSGEGVWLQGYDSDRVAVLIDGIPLAAGTGSSVDINQIAIGDVERIEISKGSMSAIYGTSAMGGVVNVITQNPKQGQTAGFSYSGGSWGSQDEDHENVPLGKQHVQAQYSMGHPNSFSQVVLDSQISNGFSAPQTNGTQGWSGEKFNLSGKSVFRLNEKTDLTVSPRLYREDILTLQDDYKAGRTVEDAKVDKTEKNYVSTVLQSRLLKNGLLKLNYSLESFHNESRQDENTTNFIDQKRLTDITHQGFISQYEYTPDYLTKFVFGIEHLNDAMNVESQTTNKNSSGDIVIDPIKVEVPNKRIENYNNFFQFSQQIDSNLEWLFSGRVNNNPKYGFNFSPMVNFQYFPHSWLPGDLSFRLGFGHGYRTPNIKELYYELDHSHIGYKVVGNEDLQPESSKNIQASMEWKPSSQTSFDISFFYNQIDNLISSDNEVSELTEQFTEENNGEHVTGNQYTNIQNAITAGSEVTLSHSFDDTVKASIAYSYLYSEDEETGNTLPQRPEHDIKLGFDVSVTPKILTSIKYIYTSEQYSDLDNEHLTNGFGQIDLKFNYNFSRKLKLFAGVNNLTGVQKEIFDGHDLRPEESRFAYFGFKLQNLID